MDIRLGHCLRPSRRNHDHADQRHRYRGVVTGQDTGARAKGNPCNPRQTVSCCSKSSDRNGNVRARGLRTLLTVGTDAYASTATVVETVCKAGLPASWPRAREPDTRCADSSGAGPYAPCADGDAGSGSHHPCTTRAPSQLVIRRRQSTGRWNAWACRNARGVQLPKTTQAKPTCTPVPTRTSTVPMGVTSGAWTALSVCGPVVFGIQVSRATPPSGRTTPNRTPLS